MIEREIWTLHSQMLTNARALEDLLVSIRVRPDVVALRETLDSIAALTEQHSNELTALAADPPEGDAGTDRRSGRDRRSLTRRWGP